MNPKKIKVFLGAYINNTNAQNLNCLALAQHLDKDKFEVYALELYSGNLESQKGKLSRIIIFNCFRPFKVSKYLGYLWGIWHCDVVYLPKRELTEWTSFLINMFRKESFSTIEGIFDKDNLKSAIENNGSYNNFVNAINSHNKLYAITSYLNDYNFKHHGIQCESKILYLGCETAIFNNKIKRSGVLKRIIYIGRLKKRKGIYDLVQLAEQFPEIEFNVYGNGEEEKYLKNLISERNIDNFNLKGVIDHIALAKALEKSDLHILPSRSEGFPKVMLETAAAGVPTIAYSDYGASKWVSHNHNGFVLESLDEIISTIQFLQENPERLRVISQNAIALAQSFDWKVLINDWEEEIIKLHSS